MRSAREHVLRCICDTLCRLTTVCIAYQHVSRAPYTGTGAQTHAKQENHLEQKQLHANALLQVAVNVCRTK